MILVAESGSSKTDWVFSPPGTDKKQHVSSIGINPFFMNHKEIIQVLKSTKKLNKHRGEFAYVYFFGAGCSSKERRKIIEKPLREFFRNAIVLVEHDLLAAALATGKGEPCITGILGTGSNACRFDGEKIAEEAVSLGYVLGDEGGGTDLGKRLLIDFCYNKLPKKLEKQFISDFHLSKDEILDAIYKQERPNKFLASFSKFIHQELGHKYMKRLVESSFHSFIDRHINGLSQSKTLPIHFVGSVAWHYRKILSELLDKNGYQMGKVVKSPSRKLYDYYAKKHDASL